MNKQPSYLTAYDVSLMRRPSLRNERKRREYRRDCAETIAYVALAIGTLPIGYVMAVVGFMAGATQPMHINVTDAYFIGACALVGIACLVAYLAAAVVITLNRE